MHKHLTQLGEIRLGITTKIFTLLLACSAMGLFIAPGQARAEEKTKTTEKDHEHAKGEDTNKHDEDGHGAKHEDEDPGHSNASDSLLDLGAFNTDLAIYTFVIFMLLLAILGKFAWPPIVKALEEREKNIADNIAAAEAKHEEAKTLLASHEAKLAATADEIRELMEEARRDAENTKAGIIAEAKKEQEAERERTLRDLDQAKNAALKQLAEASADAAIDLAGKVVQNNLTQDQQAQVVRDALQKFSATPSNN